MKRVMVVVCVVAAFLVGLVLGYSWNEMYSSSFSTPQSTYRSVKVVSGQLATIQFGSNEYYFMYKSPPWIDGDQFSVSTPTMSANIHPTTVNATFRDFGLEIKVSEVHSDYIILLVKETS